MSEHPRNIVPRDIVTGRLCRSTGIVLPLSYRPPPHPSTRPPIVFPPPATEYVHIYHKTGAGNLYFGFFFFLISFPFLFLFFFAVFHFFLVFYFLFMVLNINLSIKILFKKKKKKMTMRAWTDGVFSFFL